MSIPINTLYIDDEYFVFQENRALFIYFFIFCHKKVKKKNSVIPVFKFSRLWADFMVVYMS